jgi:ABC-type amino acid transport substrate-binding protein
MRFILFIVRPLQRIAVKRMLRRGSLFLLALFLSAAVVSPVAEPFEGGARVPAAPAFPAKLIVGVLAGGWAPFDMLQDGRLTGVSGDYLRALVGPNVVIEAQVFPDMPQLLAAACAGNIDLLMSVARTPERERCINFTAPYFRSSISAVVRRDGDRYASRRELAGARLAIERGFALERPVRESFPRAQINAYATTRAALAAVVRGEADAYFGFTPVVQYGLATEEFRGLHVAFEEGAKVADLRFGVPRARTALRDQLNRALASMNPAEGAAIRVRWLSGNFNAEPAPAARQFVLTPQEKEWLRSLPPLQIGFDSNWPPFSLVDDSGRPAGITAEYLAYLSSTLGIVFNRARLSDWPAAVEAFQRGELAMLATASNHGPPLNDASYSRAYEIYPMVIVGRAGEPGARSLDDFAWRRAVIPAHVAGSVPHVFDAIAPDHIVIAPSLDDALRMVAHGEADVMVANAAAADFQLRRRYAGVLKILGTLGRALTSQIAEIRVSAGFRLFLAAIV